MKKVIALLCMMTMLSSAFTAVNAESTDNISDKTEILSALGIDNSPNSGYATKDYYFGALSGFFYEDGYKPSAEDFARNAGMVGFGEIYKGNDNLSVDEALKCAAIALGYKGYAESFGSYGSIIGTLGIKEGITDSGDALITVKDCKNILYNMLDCEPMIAVISGNEVSYETDSNATLLSKYRDISYVRGKVTADEYTSLSEETGCFEGYIRIDNTEYEYNIETEETLLGKNVESYVKNSDADDPVVLYIGENEQKNSEITIEAQDIENITDDYSAIYYTSGNKRKTLKISAVPKVIFNGVFYEGYQHADFKPETGSIRAIDNDADGKYDVIFIYSYDTVIVNATDAVNKSIYGKHTEKPVVLEPEKGDIRYYISDGMSEMDFSEIKVSDVLSIAESKSEENKIINILVSREYVSGLLTRINNAESEITIEDTPYSFTSAFLRFAEAETRELELGIIGTFYLDVFGNVVAWSGSAEDGYVVLYKACVDDSVSKYSMIYMNLNGEWLEVPLAESIYYNEKKFAPEDIFDKLKAARGQVIKIKTNSAGEIKTVETAVETAKYDPNKFTKTPATEYTWRSALKSFNCEYFVDNDAKVIIIPADAADKNAYQVREPSDYFQSDKKYTVSFYDFDEYNFTNFVSMTYTPRVNDTLLVVKSVSETFMDGEVLDKITGCTSDYDNITVVGKDDKIFDSITAGDVVKISLNTIGRADETETVYNMKNAFIPMTVSTIYTTTGNVAGTVSMIDAGKERMQVMCNGTKYNFRVDSTSKVLKYDTEENEIEMCNYLSIIPNDKVFIRLKWGKVQDIIIKR